VGYRLKLGDTYLDLGVSAFNVFNRQKAVAYVDTVEGSAGVPDPDFLREADFQSPRYYRFSARWSF